MPIWGWVCVGLVTVLALVWALIVVYGLVVNRRERRLYEADAEEFVGWIVQANTALYSAGGIDRPAQVLVAFDGVPAVPDPSVGELAARMAALKGREPSDGTEAFVADLVNDESYKPFERFRLPDEFTGGREVYSVHVWVERSLLPDSRLQHPFIRCLLFRDQPDTRPLMGRYRPSDDQYKRYPFDESPDDGRPASRGHGGRAAPAEPPRPAPPAVALPVARPVAARPLGRPGRPTRRHRATDRAEWDKAPLPLVLGLIAALVLVGGCAGVVALAVALWPAGGGPGVPLPAPAPVAVQPPRDPNAIWSIDDALTALRDPGRQRDALKFLAGAPPDNRRKPEVAQALAAFPADRHPDLTDPYLDALATWGMATVNAEFVNRLAADPKLPEDRDRAVRVAAIQRRWWKNRDAAELLARVAFRGPPHPAAEGMLRKCFPEIEKVCLTWAFDPDPTARRRAEAMLASVRLVWKDGAHREDREGARQRIDQKALEVLGDPDPARAEVAFARIKASADPSQGTAAFTNVLGLVHTLRQVVKKRPDSPIAGPFAELIAGLVSRANAAAALQALGPPQDHPALVEVFAAAAKSPPPEVADQLIAWLGHPTAGAAAVDGLKAIGPPAVPRLKEVIRTGDSTVRARCRAVLAAVAPGEANPAGVTDPALRTLVADLVDVPGTRDAADRLDALAARSPAKVSAGDRDAVVKVLLQASRAGHPTAPAPDWGRNVIRAMTRWATDRHAAEAAALVASHGYSYDVSDLVALVGRARPKHAAEAVVRASLNPANREAAVAAIAAIGPGAEPEVLRALTVPRSPPERVVTFARMLEVVGTKKSLPELEKVRRDSASRVGVGLGPEGVARVKAALDAIEKAVTAIEAREGEDK